MNYKLVKILRIETTLDSSETIMFGEGGAHEIVIKNEEECSDFCAGFDQIIVRVQMEKGHEPRFNHITSEAKKHRSQWDEINKKEEEEKKKASASTSHTPPMKEKNQKRE